MNELDKLMKDYKFVYEIQSGINNLQKGIHDILFYKLANPDEPIEIKINNINFDIIYGILKSDQAITIVLSENNQIACVYNKHLYLLTINDDKITVGIFNYIEIESVNYE